jgi:hypothetical protein
MLTSAVFAAPATPSSDHVQTPDEEDFLDALPWLNPAVLPALIDAGLVNETVESAIPDLIDEYPNAAVGGCSLSVGAPSATSGGLRVEGSATMSCGTTQTLTKLVVCLQRKVGDRWQTLQESCRPAVSTGQTSTSKRTSALCTSGTWKYRVYAAASSVAQTINVAARSSGAAKITCRTLGF